MGHERGAYSYIESALQEPLLRPGDIDVNRTLNLMRREQRIQWNATQIMERQAAQRYGTRNRISEELFGEGTL